MYWVGPSTRLQYRTCLLNKHFKTARQPGVAHVCNPSMQQDHCEPDASLGYISEFKASLAYSVRPYIKQTIPQNKLVEN